MSMLVFWIALCAPDARGYRVTIRATATPTAAHKITQGAGNAAAHTNDAVGVRVIRMGIRCGNGAEQIAPTAISAAPISGYTK
ncbi:hypothetical protein ACH4OY_30335 [Micromonospora rubida]|uniref:Secreted protein n=1 Tax=Micromonospora rubida TaxID=2697657 RepID=A0ABW7STC6_9ACTN